MDAKMTCDKERLVGFLYDEIDVVSRRAMEAHLASCPACRDEIAALRTTRRQLAEWAPPEYQLGFQIVSGAARPARSRFGFSPAWGLAAAAVLVLAAAAAVANLDVSYNASGLTIRTGWNRAPVAPASAAPSAEVTNASMVVPAEIASRIEVLDRRLRELESVRPAAASAAVQNASGPRVTDTDVLRRVGTLVNESETRQNRELALRIRQLHSELEAQRRVDLATIQQGLQGATGAEVAMHRELYNYVNGLYRVSLQSK